MQQRRLAACLLSACALAGLARGQGTLYASPSGSSTTASAGSATATASASNATQGASSNATQGSGAAGQSQIPSNATLLTGQGPIYKKQDTLAPFFANLYRIPARGSNGTDADISITVEALGGGVAGDIGVYCNPGWGDYDSTTNIPQPGYSVWQSDPQSGSDSLFISKNDRLYRPPWARVANTTGYTTFQPRFLCSVINLDSSKTVAYRLEAALITNKGSLKGWEQKALGRIFQQCCNSTDGGVCAAWKAQNAAKGALVTDFCAFPRQICTANGTLFRLDLRNANLQCPFPAADMAIFTSLQALNLGFNPNMTGSVSDVLNALANAKSLRYLNLFKARGLSGPFRAPGTPPSLSGVCQLAQGPLRTLNADGVNLNGTIPACLLNNGSSLVELHLGNNALTGSIPDVVTASSKMQVMTLYRNRLTGALPPSLGNAGQLTNLDVSNNTLGGAIPKELGDCPNLKYCILRSNNFTGSLPSALATAPQLETIDVKLNQLTALPAEWVTGWPGAVNSTLVNVRTSFNRLRGPFPAALGRAPQLNYLIINNNTLSGTLPRGNNLFPALRALNASNNRFNGSIPESLGNTGIFTLKPLQFEDGAILSHVFDLSNNQLTGQIPSFLDMSAVQQVAQNGIYLAGNKLSYTCNAQHMYLSDLCGADAAPFNGSTYTNVTGARGSNILNNGAGSAPANVSKTGYLGPVSAPYAPLIGGLPFPVGALSPAQSGRSALNPVQQAGNPVAAPAAGPAQAPPPPPSSSPGGVPLGLIIGLVVAGAVIALALVAVIAFCCCCRRRGGAPPPAPTPASALPQRKTGLKGMGGALRSHMSGMSGKGNGFERFDEGPGVEMSRNKMSGYGAAVAPGGR